MGFTKRLLTAGAVIGGAAGALAIYNRVTESMAGELDTALSGEERRYPWKYGDMFYQVKGARDAKPLVLIHSFGLGASSYEWRKNIDALAEQFRVFVVDLLGFGLSDHPSIDYTAETFADLIGDFVKEVIGKPSVVVAHGLTCAYIVADAYRRPQLFERLVLVSPPSSLLQEVSTSPLNDAVKFVLRAPILGEFVYNLLNSRDAIRNYFDEQGYQNPGLISDELVEYVYTSAHQPNSRYAQASFLSNSLNMDVHDAFMRLQVPVTIVWGRESSPSPSEISKDFKLVNSNVDVRILDRSRFNVQDEQATAFNNLIKEFASVAAK